MPDDHSNTIVGATEITLGTDFSGTLDYGWGSDFFAIDFVAGETYRFEFDLFDGPFPILRLGIVDSDGTDLWQLADISDTALTIRPVVSGRYFIDVSNHLDEEDGSASYLGAYTGHVQIIDDDFPRQVLPSDGAINPDETVTGTIDYDMDTDEIALNVEENGIYRIVINDATSSLRAAVNQSTGFSSWTTGVGGEEEMLFVATSDDLVEISMRGWTEGATYSYSVERIGTDDHSALHSKATLLQNGDAFNSNIAFKGDVDAFEIVGVSGSKYTVTIDLDDADTLDGLKTSLRNMYDDDASAIITTTATQITFEWTFRTDTTYFLEVGTTLRSVDYNVFGDYTISMSVVTGPRIIYGGGGHDHFVGNDEAIKYVTNAGNDTVFSGRGDDTVDLGHGDDVAIAGGGREEFDGGFGNDLLSYYRSEGGVNVNLLTNEVSGGWAEDDVIEGFENISASRTGDDVIRGTHGANIIKTHGGNDRVYALGSDDEVWLGDGDDYVLAGGGREVFHGGTGNDYISYYNSDHGITINLATNYASGSWADDDTIRGFENVSGSQTGNDNIFGSNGANIIKTYGGNDKVFAKNGNDKVYDGKGDDRVFLGNGDDYVRVGGGADNFHGGAGRDYISYYNSSGGVTLNLETNEASGSWAENDTIFGFESASGSKTGNDKIYGTAGANTIKTYGGDDRVYAGAGSDQVFLGDGNDYVLAGGGQEAFHGGDGTDYISYYNSSSGVTLNLATNEASRSWASNDTISGFESASGSRVGHDIIYGTTGANRIKTYGGNDKVYARGGGDSIFLGTGNDYVLVGDGAGEFHGGDGVDYISYFNSVAGVSLNLETNETSGSWADNHTISGFEGVSGSEFGNDTIYGNTDHNLIRTYGGDDIIHAGRGRDTVYAGTGNDQVFLGDDDDFAVSGGGTDHFDGGRGDDVVNYNDSESGVVINLAANTASGGWAEVTHWSVSKAHSARTAATICSQGTPAGIILMDLPATTRFTAWTEMTVSLADLTTTCCSAAMATTTCL